VRDGSGRPLASATVSLHLPGASPASVGIPGLAIQITRTDSEGAFQLSKIEEGDYFLLAGTTDKPTDGHAVHITRDETATVDIALPAKLTDAKSAEPRKPATEKPAASPPEFFDEPQFTVAGVTQATTSGGHGSQTIVRSTEALARATVSLANDSDVSLTNNSNNEKNKDNESTGRAMPLASAASESSLRDSLARNPLDPALHHSLGEVEEKLHNPLDAVREYQRAAELDPSEPNLFDWGTELLTHRALEPATEVFTKGNHLFPRSARMLVALGVTWYARGNYDRAAECLVSASDIFPERPMPYLFLGKMQTVLTFPTAGVAERLARFAQLQPENALANYYYAVSLWKQSEGGADTSADTSKESFAHIESLLGKAVQLDPRFGAAYLQLGILHSRRGDLPLAISAYQKAIVFGPESDDIAAEAHYRLAQAYQRTGDKTGAKQELELHDLLAKKIKAQAESERRDIQEFVISLQKKDSPLLPQP
jgi:tetratricopeptide (TPR) repeat protein